MTASLHLGKLRTWHRPLSVRLFSQFPELSAPHSAPRPSHIPTPPNFYLTSRACGMTGAPQQSKIGHEAEVGVAISYNKFTSHQPQRRLLPQGRLKAEQTMVQSLPSCSLSILTDHWNSLPQRSLLHPWPPFWQLCFSLQPVQVTEAECYFHDPTTKRDQQEHWPDTGSSSLWLAVVPGTLYPRYLALRGLEAKQRRGRGGTRKVLGAGHLPVVPKFLPRTPWIPH